MTVLAAPPTGDPMALSSRTDDEGWTLVQSRRRKLDGQEATSAIIWNAPKDADPGQAAKMLTARSGRQLRCKWRGTNHNRHMVVLFSDSLHKASSLERVRKICASIGLRLVNTRKWATRAQQRALPAPEAAPVEGEMEMLRRLRQRQLTTTAAAELEMLKRLRQRQLAAAQLEKKRLKRMRQRQLQRQGLHTGTAEAAKAAKAAKAAQLAAEKKAKEESDRKAAELARGLRRCSSFRLGSLNVDGGLLEKIAELEERFLAKKYDVVVLQETRLARKAKLTVKGFTVF